MTAPVEQWRPVVGFEGLYDVSDAGRVRRSLDARKIRSSVPGKIRNTWVSSTTGYREVVLYKPGHKPVRRTVHTLVMAAFAGPPPPGLEVLHDNQDRADCRLSNLRYGTRSENHLQAYAQGRPVAGAAGRPGSANYAAKLTPAQVLQIRREYQPGSRHGPGNCTQLAARFSVSGATIRHVASRKTWRHLDSEAAPA